MRYCWIIILSVALAISLPVYAEELQADKKPEKFVIYYSDQAPLESFADYDLLILDSDSHPPLLPLAEQGKKLLGYISLGEIEHQRSYFNAVKNEGLLLKENPNWPGSYSVDVRDKRWAKRVVEEIVPYILSQGFNGVFLDTLDNPPELERVNPEKYKGMTEASVNLVKAIRLHYPQITIMMNRGYALLPKVAPSIDMELGESIYADYNFNSKTYSRVKDSLYHEQVKILKDAQKVNPKLQVYTLDYADKNDAKSIKDIYREERKNGFIPYVSTISLTDIVTEPK